MQRIILKRLVTVAAMAAMVLAITVPALAGVSNTGNSQNVVGQASEQQVESGDATQNMSVTGGGDNSNQCFGDSSVANTGNAANNTGVLQTTPSNNDGNNWNGWNNWNGNNGNNGQVEVGNGDFTISPSSTTTCDQQVNQAASASGN